MYPETGSQEVDRTSDDKSALPPQSVITPSAFIRTDPAFKFRFARQPPPPASSDPVRPIPLTTCRFAGNCQLPANSARCINHGLRPRAENSPYSRVISPRGGPAKVCLQVAITVGLTPGTGFRQRGSQTSLSDLPFAQTSHDPDQS
jgi:hypothetical protein